MVACFYTAAVANLSLIKID